MTVCPAAGVEWIDDTVSTRDELQAEIIFHPQPFPDPRRSVMSNIAFVGGTSWKPRCPHDSKTNHLAFKPQNSFLNNNTT